MMNLLTGTTGLLGLGVVLAGLTAGCGGVADSGRGNSAGTGGTEGEAGAGGLAGTAGSGVGGQGLGAAGGSAGEGGLGATGGAGGANAGAGGNAAGASGGVGGTASLPDSADVWIDGSEFFGQEGALVRGRIMDSITGEALPEQAVRIHNGRFRLKFPAGLSFDTFGTFVSLFVDTDEDAFCSDEPAYQVFVNNLFDPELDPMVIGVTPGEPIVPQVCAEW